MPGDQHPAPIREEAVWLCETQGQPLVAQKFIAQDAGISATDWRSLAWDSDRDTLSHLIRAESKGTKRHRAVRTASSQPSEQEETVVRRVDLQLAIGSIAADTQGRRI
jgi:hypothetical protein